MLVRNVRKFGLSTLELEGMIKKKAVRVDPLLNAGKTEGWTVTRENASLSLSFIWGC